MTPNHNQENDLHTLFASPFRNDANDILLDTINKAVRQMNELKPNLDNSAAFLGNNPDLTLFVNASKQKHLQEKGQPLTEVIDEMVSSFEGLPNWGHPLNLSNICPQESIAAIAASMITQIFSPNMLESEYAWNTSRAELESSSILASLAGWDTGKAGGLYTYGGSGCWLYHLKYAISRVLPDSRNSGVRTDAKVICSEQAHYAVLNSTDWTGLGMNNIIKVRTVPETNAMDLEHLESILQECAENKIPVLSVVCTMGTTDANAFDPVKKVRMLLERYPNDSGYGKALLYCDSVIGWSWLAFKEYDFDNNPRNYAEPVIISIRKNLEAIQDMYYADAFGVDFHKSFAPLTSSIFVYRNSGEFEALMKRQEVAYLQEHGDYNPHHYTLEVSRSAGGAMAGWAMLKHLGAEGICDVLAKGLSNKIGMLQYISGFRDMICANLDDNGPVILLRMYEPGTDASQQYADELNDPEQSRQLQKNNKFNEKIAETLWHWFREKKKFGGRYTPYISISKGFRPAAYAGPDDQDHVIYAIKIYPVNVFISEDIMKHAFNCIIAAREEVLKKNDI